MDTPVNGWSTDENRTPASKGEGRVTAVLGPTNTGKTFLAVERMLGHAKGMIGFPLRLLARENYDKIVKQKGSGQVALITGEEKIIPPRPRYYVCTVESMPLDIMVDFLAIDEIQMAADPERGHIFTERLLYARGLDETMFLGSETAKHLIRKLVPHCEFVTRPRFSTLSYAGHKKVTRLPPRSAVVGFSAAEVYRIAELIRRQRGGTAVVMGSLSPRARNAQVGMYQAGEVDYLVATDAIGMGLNMDVRHVAFSALHKYDGHKVRDLLPGEIGQIAGRAGRHMTDGSFGTSADLHGMDEELVKRVEEHDYDTIRTLMWRNVELDFRSTEGLLRTLEEKPPEPFLRRARRADDQRTLESLAKMPSVAAKARGYDAVKLLWDVCQVPDFSKTLTDTHTRLLARIFEFRAQGEGQLPNDWVANHINRLDRTEGDIDTLMARIASTRTWTYITHRSGWLAEPEHWRAKALAIEDNLSDALHARLTQRFVDRRTAVLVRRLRDGDELIGGVSSSGEVVVEGETVGTLNGFRFTADTADRGEDGRALINAANRVLRQEVDAKVQRICQAKNRDFALAANNRVTWAGEPIGRLAKGSGWLKPCVEPLASALLDSRHRQALRARLQSWLDAEIARKLGPLVRLIDLDGPPALRGIVFRMGEQGGIIEKRAVRRELDQLKRADRRKLTEAGMRIGADFLFLPALLKGPPNRWLLTLWQLFNGPQPVPDHRAPVLPADGSTCPDWYRVCGYVIIGRHAIRIDHWERFAGAVYQRAEAGAVAASPDLAKQMGCTPDDLPLLLKRLRFFATGDADEQGSPLFAKREKKTVQANGASGKPRKPPKPSKPQYSPTSPFAGLKQALATAGTR